MSNFGKDYDVLKLGTDGVEGVKRASIAHIEVAATVAASAVVKAASATTDTLTTSGTAAIGARVNALSVLLATAVDDTLVAAGNDTTGVITITLAKTTANNNTAAKIQVLVRALTTVAGVDVSAFTCVAAGNWDTAAIATGETAAVDFTGGVSDAEAASATAVHAAFATTTIDIAATCVVEADTAVTDILTTTALPVTIGASANALSINLETAADDNLVVSAVDLTGIITVALADTTAAKNTAALIQVAIRALATVSSVDVSAFTCVAGGNWDTAAIATGETAEIDFEGGQDAVADVLTTDITDPYVARTITATAGGTAGDIKAIQVIIVGTDMNDEALTETLPIFTVNTAGIVTGTKAFKTVTSITIPAHDGTGATTSIGFSDILGVPYKLSFDTVLKTYLNDTVEGTAPTVTVSSTVLASNTVDLNSALDGNAVDLYLIAN